MMRERAPVCLVDLIDFEPRKCVRDFESPSEEALTSVGLN